LYPQYLKGLSSSQLTYSLVASLSISLPILFDGLLDYLASVLVSFKINTFYFLNDHARSTDYVPFREMILFIVIPDALFLFWIIPYEQYDILAGLLFARDILFTYSYLTSMVRHKNPIWTWWTTIPIILPLMSAKIIYIIPPQIYAFHGNIQNGFYFLAILMVSMALLILTVNLIRWFWFVKRRFSNGKNEEEDSKLVLNSVFAVCFYIFILGEWSICYLPQSTSPTWTTPVGYNYLTMYSYLMAGSILIISVISSRLTRVEYQESKVSTTSYIAVE